MQDNDFTFTVRLDLNGVESGVHTGLAMFEKNASGLEVVQSGDKRRLDYFHLSTRIAGPILAATALQLRVAVSGDEAHYFFSLDDGRTFQPLGPATLIHFSWWKGSRPSLFAFNTLKTTLAFREGFSVNLHVFKVQKSEKGWKFQARVSGENLAMPWGAQHPLIGAAEPAK